jgi:hypothetical protein
MRLTQLNKIQNYLLNIINHLFKLYQPLVKINLMLNFCVKLAQLILNMVHS